MLFAWFCTTPDSTANVSPTNRCTPVFGTPTAGTSITGGSSGFSTACTRVSWLHGVSIHARPCWDAARRCGNERKMPRWIIHGPNNSCVPSVRYDDRFTVTISACGSKTVSRRWFALYTGGPDPFSILTRSGRRSCHGVLAAVGSHCCNQLPGAPGNDVNDAPTDNGSGR